MTIDELNIENPMPKKEFFNVRKLVLLEMLKNETKSEKELYNKLIAIYPDINKRKIITSTKIVISVLNKFACFNWDASTFSLSKK